MDTPSQSPALTAPQVVLLGLVIAAASAALWGSAEHSKRGFRLLDWLEKHSKSELPPAESDQ
ncbi:hypothetical protein [Streptomyces microflavus]|uniref:hypothetical protein n=1 Tax=Streptomyces microflavus TaxID=1919 RepID=UPI003656AA92